MGIFDFFRDRRARESAMPAGALEDGFDEPAARQRSPLFDSPASAEGNPPAQTPSAAADLGAVGRLIRSALEQGNVTILAGEEVLDLGPAGLRGHAFEPVKLPESDDGPPSPDSA